MIRTLQPDKDLNRVADEIWLKESIREFNFISSQFWREQLPKMKQDTIDSEGYVYEEDGIIKGFITIKSKEHYILELFVNYVFQKNGIGTALLNFAKEQHPFLILSVYKKNRRVIRWYKNRDFFKVSKPYKEIKTGLKKFVMEWKKQPINIAVFEYEEAGELQRLTASTFIKREEAILHGWQMLQIKHIDGQMVRRIYSEWKPPDEVKKFIEEKCPNVDLTYSYENGDEAKFENDKRKLLKKKWWGFW